MSDLPKKPDDFPKTRLCAEWYRNLLAENYGYIAEPDEPPNSDYIAYTIAGKQRVWFYKRRRDQQHFAVELPEANVAALAQSLNEKGITCKVYKAGTLNFKVPYRDLEKNRKAHSDIVQQISPNDRIRFDEP